MAADVPRIRYAQLEMEAASLRERLGSASSYQREMQMAKETAASAEGERAKAQSALGNANARCAELQIEIATLKERGA
jgi:uncharacterized protein YceH (UPF0502 family)